MKWILCWCFNKFSHGNQFIEIIRDFPLKKKKHFINTITSQNTDVQNAPLLTQSLHKYRQKHDLTKIENEFHIRIDQSNEKPFSWHFRFDNHRLMIEAVVLCWWWNQTIEMDGITKIEEDSAICTMYCHQNAIRALAV